MPGKYLIITNHQWNIQALMMEVFKIMKNLVLLIMDNMFAPHVNNFNLRNIQEFAIDGKKTVKCGLETLNFRYPQFWTLVPDTIKTSSSLIKFK